MLQLIHEYYQVRELKWPESAEEALMWAVTELGEVYELLLARHGGWVRNNPSGHPSFEAQRLAEELGDVIMMMLVAGIVEGVDPLSALWQKLDGKIQEIHNEER